LSRDVIVSHRHRLIFIKTRKTAGTSIEIALAKFCGDADIITRDTAADQALRAELGVRGPQHEYGIPYRDYRVADWRRLLLRGERARFKNHMAAERIRKLVGEAVWRDYYKVCVERNPWDKAVSLYYWRTRSSEPRPPLLDFLRRVSRRSLSNFHLYADVRHNTLLVDRVLRYEQLDGELDALMRRLGLPPLELPRAKAAHRPPQTEYRSLMGPAERAIVDAACAREIALFDYHFD
jgi:hypothetical protein